MSEAAFWDSTPRQVNTHIQAALERQRLVQRTLKAQAWWSAVYQRIDGRHFPTLAQVLELPIKPVRQSADQQKDVLMQWAAHLSGIGLVKPAEPLEGSVNG